ncbi:MAG: addiction module protein [Micrococcales bacterium]|nr:addiction module protein [Micrococcales bacterium]
MTPQLAEYLKAGYTLAPEERLEAARLLRLSVDRDDTVSPLEVEAAWRDEIAARVDAIAAGQVELVDADETYRLLSAELAAKHQ